MFDSDPKMLIMSAALLVLLLLFIRQRQRLVIPFGAALVISLIWSLYFRYEYVNNNLFLFDRINVYPLVLWTVGLTLLHVITHYLPRRYRLTLTIVSYLAFVMAAEAVGYYLLNIRLNSQYTSLLGLGVIHAPIPMKIFYMFAGPLYIIFLDWFAARYQNDG